MPEEVNFEKVLEELEKKLVESEKNWDRIIGELSKRITCELKETVQLEADAMSYRQIIIDEKTNYLYKIYKDMPKIKQLRKTQFEYYALKYQIKTNGTERTKLIDADLSYYDAKIEILENHINFLTESLKSVDHVLWGIKNKIAIHNLLGEEYL